MRKLLLIVIVAITACSSPSPKKDLTVTKTIISETSIKNIVDSIKTAQPASDLYLLKKGVKHAASLWRKEDGTPHDFSEFVKTNYISDHAKRKVVFNKLSKYMEALNGYYNEITLSLRETLDESIGDIDEIDRMFGNYAVGSHMPNDFYANKIAFPIALNFPYYSLAEKEESGPKWSREEWAMARLGDLFISRVPAELEQAVTEATGNSEMYIAEYNIHMGHLRTDGGIQIFPDNMVLLSHWNLRDELKADYADKKNGIAKQEMIYKVMERIISQEIPAVVINSSAYEWAPVSNKVTQGGKPVETKPEPDTRYIHIIDNFRTRKAVDSY